MLAHQINFAFTFFLNYNEKKCISTSHLGILEFLFTLKANLLIFIEMQGFFNVTIFLQKDNRS